MAERYQYSANSRGPFPRATQLANPNEKTTSARQDVPSPVPQRSIPEPRAMPQVSHPPAASAQWTQAPVDLEAELMQELQASFDAIRRPFEPHRKPEVKPVPAPVAPPSRATPTWQPIRQALTPPTTSQAAPPVRPERASLPIQRDTDPFAADPFAGLHLRGRGSEAGNWGDGLPAPGSWQPEADAEPLVHAPLEMDDYGWPAHNAAHAGADYGVDPRLDVAFTDDPGPAARAAPYGIAPERADLFLDDREELQATATEHFLPSQFTREEPAEKPRSRRGLVIAGVIVGLALVGTAVVALRGVDLGESAIPTLISADASPTKIDPDPVAATSQNPLLLGQQPGQETITAMAEEPITALPATPGAGANPNDPISRIILPEGNAAGASPAAEGGIEPRMVRTLVVRPDGTVLSSQSAPAGTQVAAAGGAVPQTNPATPATTPASPPVQVAAAPVPAATPAAVPAREGMITVTPGAEGFVVSLVSVRTEEQARGAFADLQRRFPALLGNREASIVSADLGERGIYWRVRVGPVSSQTEANGFCSTLKAAGGDCFVVPN